MKKPRSKMKTKWLRTLIWAKGTWRSRMVRCAICRKGVLPRNTVYDRGGSPGGQAIRDMLDCCIEFPCGHLIDDHKTVEESQSRIVQLKSVEIFPPSHVILDMSLKPDPDYVEFGEIARRRCDEQAQYCSRTIDGFLEYPNLGEGLRFRGDPRDYHFVEIHKDDVEEFVTRWKAYKARQKLGR